MIHVEELIERADEFLEGFADVAKRRGFQKKTMAVHHAGTTKSKFRFGGKKYSSKTKGGATTIKRHFAGGLIRRKVGSVSGY